MIAQEMWLHMILIVIYVLVISWLDIALHPWLEKFKGRNRLPVKPQNSSNESKRRKSGSSLNFRSKSKRHCRPWSTR